MGLQSKVAQMRAGATPQSFDGAQKIRMPSNDGRPSTIVSIVLSASMSIITTDEGAGMAVKLTAEDWAGSKIFPMGWLHASPNATNLSCKPAGQDILGVDIPVKSLVDVQVDISTILGAVQTGTWDVTVGLLIDDGYTPKKVLDRIPFPIREIAGSNFGYTTALTTTTKTDLSTIKIPASAQAIVAGKFLGVLDTAITADEEITSYFTLTDDAEAIKGTHDYPGMGGSPGLGTEVNSGEHGWAPWIPMFIDLSKVTKEITVTPSVTAYSAITGGADYACALAWTEKRLV